MEKTIKYLENGEYHYATVKDVGDLAKLKTDSKDDLVTAINELFITGGEAPKKPDGYDELVDNVADAIQKQQQMTDTITNMQQSAQLSDAEMEHMKQVQEELHQEYLKAIKELNEAVDKAKADAADLDKKTSDLQDKLDETFASVDKEVSDVHKQLDSESAGLRKDLDDTKTSLESTRKDLLNNTQEFGVVNSEVKELKDKMDRRIWSTDLDPVREQVNKNTTEVSQTKDELKNKADQSSLDLVTNSVENLSTQVKENADGLKVSVKKDELGGDVARLLNDKTNLLLGTRNFSGDSWSNKTHWHEEPGYWKGLKVFSSTEMWSGLQYKYEVKQGQQYTFSFWARQEKDNSSASIVLSESDKGDQGIATPYVRGVHIGTEWKRYSLTFQAESDGIIYPRVEQNVQGNKLYIAGYKLELGSVATPWEPNEADVAENIEHNESQFNVYSDQIAGIVKKQEKMGDTERQLDTRITETAEGLKQTSKDLQDANGKITEFKGQLESTARGLKTEYEKYTNDAIGQISDSSLNLIRNSAFQNKDDNFAQWQNVSAKANIREDGNGLRWVELTQSGMTTDNPQGITSNYFVIKQGKVTVAVDIKLGDKANLDNQNILLLELYNDNKQRVDFTDVSVSQLGLSTAILNDHNVHRGLYRLGIDRKDVKYMTVKAILHRNGDLWLTNFSARLSSIDDGGYTPNPDDVNQQILKQNTKIEQDAKQIALKANSVDVTRDIKSAVQNSNGGGINLIKKSSFHNMTIDQVGNAWSIGQGVSINPKGGTGSAGSIIIDAQNIVDSNSYTEITQSIDVEPNNDYTFSLRLLWGKAASGKSFNAYTFMVEHTSDGGTTSPYQDNNRHIANSPSRSANTYTVHTSANTHSLLLYIRAMGGSYIELEEVKLERGPVATPWTPNSQDTSEEIKSAKDAAIKVASDQINIHVNELSTSFDDKLNKRVNEAKTASEKFTSDGIEQTVKKITDVKNQVDDIQIGGVNVLHNTDPTNEILSGNITANSWVCASGGNGYGTADPLGAPFNAKRYFRLRGHTQGVKDFSQRPINWKNSKYTFSIYARLDPETGATSISAYIRSWSIKKNKEVFRQNFTVNSKEWEKFTFTFDASTFFSDDTASFAFGISGVGSIDFAEPMLVTGTKAMDWAPNPDDVSQTMSLDSANIDNLRSQGHYFVHSLTGNPLGSGWVYVDVIGNNSDRIRQDVYQDNGNKHMYRRLFGTAWSGWEQGAYLSDVNNVKTEVTASVKNLGDRVTTEVNSITSRVNSNNGGGINLQVGTDDCSFPIGNNGNEVNIENYSGTTKMFHAKKGGFYSSYNAKSFVPTPGETYTLSADVKGNGIISGGLFRYEGGDNGNLGTIKLTNDWQRISNTVHINKVSGQWVFYIRDSNDFYVKHIKIERGSVATPWSPAPEDTAETIKTLNTKWDVANGQIQGKVTETDVNNILNGKGYATQSWAESNFRMKSDSIDLEVKKITDPISNKLNNLQVGTRNLLHNTSDQWRTLTNNNGWLQQTTSSSCWTSVADYHGGDKFTYAAKITNNSHQQAELEGWLCDQNKNWINGQAFHAPIPKGANAYDVSVTFPITADTWYIRSWIIFTGGQAPNGDSVKVKDERLVEGATPGSWSPNPDDINQQITNTNNKIDTQTLDSANIDQMKTQGHYFVKNLTGNPIGGWVYVDVTGNNDRIRQDVYADQSYVHKFRSWNGSRWTDWEEEVKNTDIISKINISPENIRLSSNKIEIDGNTYIHGELNVPNVKLNGNNGSVDLSGDGIHIGGPDGDIKLDSGGIDITKSGQGLSITGDYIQVVTDSNGQKEITGLIGSNFNLKNKNQNGLALLVTPQQELGRPYGGDLLTIGELEKSGEVTSAVTFDATNITGDGSGFHWTAPHYLHGPAQAIHIENTQDNLTLLPLKMPNSFQEGYYQPALTTTHGVDGNGNWVQGDSGIEFLWNSVKPYGAIDMTDADILMKGANGKLRFGWAQHDKMWNNQQKFPALYRLGNNGGIDSGIAFAWGSTWDLGTGAHNITSVMMNSGA